MLCLVEEYLINLLGFHGQPPDARHFLDQPFWLAKFCGDYRSCDPLSLTQYLIRWWNNKTTSADGIASNTKDYDDLLPNPCGSTSSDTAKREADKFIKRKCPFLITTFNTRSVLKDTRKPELATHTSKFQIGVICLQEHRIIHTRMRLQKNLLQKVPSDLLSH